MPLQMIGSIRTLFSKVAKQRSMQHFSVFQASKLITLSHYKVLRCTYTCHKNFARQPLNRGRNNWRARLYSWALQVQSQLESPYPRQL